MNGHFDYSTAQKASVISNMKKMGMTVYRLTWEGDDTSLNAIVAQAQAFRSDGTGLRLYVTLDVSTQDIATGVTFTTEAKARAYGFTSGQHCAQALAPYADVIIGISTGNEMTRKDSLMPNNVVQGTNPSDFSNTKWPIFRGVQAGTLAGIKSVTTAIPVFSNAWTFAEIAAPIMLRDGTNPDGSGGGEKVVSDGYDIHNYHAWNNMFAMPDSNHGGWVPFFNYVEQYKVQFGGKPIMISEANADADSQTDADMATWNRKVLTDVYASRFDLNIAGYLYYAMFDADFKWGCVDSSNNLIATRGQELKKFIVQNPDVDNGSITQKAMAVLAKYPAGSVRMYVATNSFQDSSGTITPTDGTGMQLFAEVFIGGANNATQSTTPATFSAAKQSLTFNGSPYLIANPFMSATDDFAVIVLAAPSGTANALSSARGVIAASATNATNKYGRVGAIMYSTAGITAEWYADTGADFQATWAYPGGTDSTPRVVTARRKGNTGSIRINGAQQATVDLTTFSSGFTPTNGWIAAQYANDTAGFIGDLWRAIFVKTPMPDEDLLILEQYANISALTGVTF